MKKQVNDRVNIATIDELPVSVMMEMIAATITGNTAPAVNDKGKTEIIAQAQGEKLMVCFKPTGTGRKFNPYVYDEYLATRIISGWLYRPNGYLNGWTSAIEEFAVTDIFKANNMVTIYLAYVG